MELRNIFFKNISYNSNVPVALFSSWKNKRLKKKKGGRSGGVRTEKKKKKTPAQFYVESLYSKKKWKTKSP